jgi:NAD(P)-dependent dehydrogenase (short-subunit alcohol dehydrogenase family)
VKGSLYVVHEFLRLVGENHEATVINVSSAMGFIVMPGKTGYNLSKLALTQLSQFIAVENPNVRAVSIHPGTIMTDITPQWLARFSRDTPALAAGCALWLTTKEAAFLNGRYISANWSVEELVQRSAEIVDGQKLLVKHTGELAY